MKTNFRKMIALLVCVCFVFSFCFNSIVSAANDDKIDKSIVKVVKDNDKECTVMATYKGDELYATINKDTNEITMESVEKPKVKAFGIGLGSDKKKGYKVKVDKAVNGEISAVVVDNETKKEFKVSKKSDKVIAQIPLAIPLIEILGGLLLEVLLGTIATVVVAGVTYYAASKVIEKLKQKSYQYYAATVVPGDNVYIAGPLNYATAVARMQMGTGNDVWAMSSSLAYTVAKGAGYGLSPVGLEIGSGSGQQYYHYHPYGRMFGTHALFSTWG